MNKISIITFLCAALSLAASVLSYCERQEPAPPSFTSHTDTLYVVDTTKHHSEANNLYTVSNYTVLPAGQIDTAAVLAAYYTKKLVTDVLEDSLIRLRITDSLYMNNITYRHRSYQLLRPQTTIITTTSIPAPVFQRGIYTGPFFSFGKGLQAAGLEAQFVARRYSYGLGYDFKNNAVQGKVLFRINLK